MLQQSIYLYLSRFIFSNKTLSKLSYNSSSGYQITNKLGLCDPFYLQKRVATTLHCKRYSQSVSVCIVGSQLRQFLKGNTLYCLPRGGSCVTFNTILVTIIERENLNVNLYHQMDIRGIFEIVKSLSTTISQDYVFTFWTIFSRSWEVKEFKKR